MKFYKKFVAAALVGALALQVLCACGKKETAEVPNAKVASYEDVVAYFENGGVITDAVDAVDINTAEGYVTDNTGGDFAVAEVADKAYDYQGLYLFWWDAANNSDLYQENFQYIDMNGGIIVIQGGAAILEPEAYRGCFAIAFADDYTNKDKALELFNAMPEE